MNKNDYVYLKVYRDKSYNVGVSKFQDNKSFPGKLYRYRVTDDGLVYDPEPEPVEYKLPNNEYKYAWFNRDNGNYIDMYERPPYGDLEELYIAFETKTVFLDNSTKKLVQQPNN